jgi:L-rhamnose mutarotase
MTHEELKSRLENIHPELVFQSRKHNVRMYKLLEDHVKKQIIPRALGKESEKSVDQMIREDLYRGKIDFSKMGKMFNQVLKDTKFKKI